MQQNKINILCTRVIDESWIKDAASKDIFIDVVSFIRIDPIRATEIQREIEQALIRSAMVVFTSGNAVERVAAELDGKKPDWQIFCIGHATRELIEKYFGKDLVSGTADNAKDLAQLIIHENVDEIIFFCGDHRLDELSNLLRKNNTEVNEIIVYQTTTTPERIKKKYDGILFFSPSAVQSFFQENKLDNQTILFAIGNTTSNELKNYTKNKVVVSETPDKKDLLETVVDYFQTNPIHH